MNGWFYLNGNVDINIGVSVYICVMLVFVFVFCHCVFVWCVYLMAPQSLGMAFFFLFLLLRFPQCIFSSPYLSVCKIIRILFSALSKSFPIQICTWLYFFSVPVFFVVGVILCMFVFSLSIEYDKRKYELVGWHAKQEKCLSLSLEMEIFVPLFSYKRTYNFRRYSNKYTRKAVELLWKIFESIEFCKDLPHTLTQTFSIPTQTRQTGWCTQRTTRLWIGFGWKRTTYSEICFWMQKRTGFCRFFYISFAFSKEMFYISLHSLVRLVFVVDICNFMPANICFFEYHFTVSVLCGSFCFVIV